MTTPEHKSTTDINVRTAIESIKAKLMTAERAERQAIRAFLAHGNFRQFDIAEMDAFYAREDAATEILSLLTLLASPKKE